jgi:hypothetical protein
MLMSEPVAYINVEERKLEWAEPITWHTPTTTMLRQQEKELTEAGHMIGVLREYISDLEKGLDSSIKLNKAQAER